MNTGQRSEVASLSIALVALGVLGVFAAQLFIVLQEPVPRTEEVSTPAEFPAGTTPPAVIGKRIYYNDEVYTVSGIALLPSSCHELSTRARVDNLSRDTVHIMFETKKGTETPCADGAHQEVFLVSFKASEAADIRATLNGQQVAFEPTGVSSFDELAVE